MSPQFCLRLHKQKSYNGYRPDVLKSAIQKYMRRQELEKGVWCLVELDLFSCLENDVSHALEQASKECLKVEIIQMNATKIRTNMVNRLVAMMSEEVSINCWWLPIKMRELYEKWTLNRKSNGVRKYLVIMYKLLVDCKKMRLISDLKTVYNLPPYYLKDFVQLCELHKELLSTNSQLFERMQKLSENKADFMDAFKQCIVAQSEDAFFYLSKLIEKEKKDFCDAIWRIVQEHSPQKSVTESLHFFFKKMTHKEKWIYLYHAILLIVNKNRIDFNSTIDDTIVSDDEVDCYYAKNLGFETVVLDNFVFDMHTRSVEANLKSKFALEGALVVDECKTFFNQDYRDLYINFKKMIDDYELLAKCPVRSKRKASEESINSQESNNFETKKRICSDEFYGYNVKDISLVDEMTIKKLPQAQKRTAAFKKAVFVDKNYVYKGPYQRYDLKLVRNLRNVKAILLLEQYLKCSKSECSIEDWHGLFRNQADEFYLVSKNVGKACDEYESEIVSTKIDSNVRVIKRQSFVKRVNEIENSSMDLRLIKCCLQHLYFRFLLGIGDSGTHNILLREDGSEMLISGIDLEEQNSDFQKRYKIDMLFKRLSKLQREFYSPHLDSIKFFTDCLSHEQKEELLKLGSDVSLIENNIKRWLKAL